MWSHSRFAGAAADHRIRGQTSLDGTVDEGASNKWAEVIERRAREVLEGTAELVDGKEAVARVRARLLERQK